LTHPANIDEGHLPQDGNSWLAGHITVYDDGGATFGHAFCISSGLAP
jgi:hypothetical protein